MSDAQERTDEQLAQAAKTGDASAYDLLVRRYLRPAMALAWQYTRSLQDAEDVVQEAFHRAVRALEGYDHGRPFSAWFYAIVRNAARSAIDKDARRSALAPFTLLESEPPAPPGPEPEHRRAHEPVPGAAAATRAGQEVESVGDLGGRLPGRLAVRTA